MMNYASSIKHCELDNVKSRKSNIQTAPAQQRELQGTPSVTSHRISHPMPATSGSAVRSLLNHPTSIARRALLLLSVFLMSFGSVWGAFIPYTGALPTPQTSTLSVENNQVVIKTSELLSLAGVDYSGKQHYIRIQSV